MNNNQHTSEPEHQSTRAPTNQRTSAPAFSLIIPNYNGAHFLKTCLDSLIKSLKETKATYEIIIIDNASTDNSFSVIANRNTPLSVIANPPRRVKQSPSGSPRHFVPRDDTFLRVIQNSTNLGFAGAVNQGINLAKYEYVVLCNNDLTVEKNYFSLLINAIKTYPQYSTFVGTVLNKEGTHFESQGLKFYYSGKCDNILNNQPVRADRPARPAGGCVRPPYEIWGASAALVTYHKATLQKIGIFDEDFFAYEEDVDLALRLHKLNYKTLLIPKAICYHLGGGTSSKMGNFRYKMGLKNWIFLIVKNYSAKEIILNFFSIIDQRLRNISGLLKNSPNGEKISSLRWTYKEIIQNLPKMIQKRKIIQNLIK